MTYPPDFTFPKEKQITAHVAAQTIAQVAPGRRAVVQAGGCAGFWPLALAVHFERVYTFEPEPMNFRCLIENIRDFPSIQAYDYALAEARGLTGLTRPKAKAGLWRLDGAGDIPMVPLDDVLGDRPIDAIVLDVEGAEVRAWQGATRVITAQRPLLWFEYLENTAAIDACLAAHGYIRPVPGVGGDYYSVHASRVAH